MRLFFGIACLFAISVSAHADTQLNAFGGVDFASITGTNGDAGAYKPMHWMGGVGADFGLTENFYLNPGLRYVEKGVAAKGTSAGLSVDIDLKIKYLEIPLYAKFKFGSGSFRPFVFAGPNLGIKVGDSVGIKISGSGININERTSGVLGEAVTSINISADAGLGAQFALGETWGMLVAGEYSLGLTDLNAKSSADSTKTRDIQAYLGAYFAL